MKEILCTVFIILCFQFTIYGQTENSDKLISTFRRINHFLNEDYDSSYIKKSPVDFILVLKSINYIDAYNVKVNNDTAFDLESDPSYKVGLSLGYKMFVLGYSYNISNLLSPNSVRSSNFNFSIPTNRLNVEFSYFVNKGKTSLVGYRTADGTFPAKYGFEGLNSKILSFDIFYFINHKRYANNSAYSTTFGYKQQKSAGSIITGISYTRQNLFFDFTKLPIENSVNLTTFKEIFNTYSAHAGYGYNLAFSKYWLTNLSVITTIGVKQNELTSNTSFNLGLKGKMAFTYNRPLFFVGINCDYTTNYNIITNSIGNFNIYIGYRFMKRNNNNK